MNKMSNLQGPIFCHASMFTTGRGKGRETTYIKQLQCFQIINCSLKKHYQAKGISDWLVPYQKWNRARLNTCNIPAKTGSETLSRRVMWGLRKRTARVASGEEEERINCLSECFISQPINLFSVWKQK